MTAHLFVRGGGEGLEGRLEVVGSSAFALAGFAS